ncbi:ABC transporter ATP-binding protein [Nocardioides currus]|uniref:ABC transporter ATP-binding protein n=1 Tax=Nocardioides currus TaxID=2133958 RepID=UPI001403948B|nr:ATP-binding cassette domain-containing protein [Nocardioides currus]
MTTLSVIDLQGGYRESVPVFSEVGFELDRGAIGVIGRNGAGKTCLAQTLSGALTTTNGSILLGGRAVEHLSPRARVSAGISLVPEGRLIFGQLTVRENLEVAVHAAGRGEKRIAAMEEQFPILGHKRSMRGASLSGGEQQLLAIARALVQEPTVVILDEPSLGLSPIAVDNLTVALRQVLDEGEVAMVLMEQNGELLTGLCHSVLLMDQGAITGTLDMGDPADQDKLFESYLGV